MGRLTKSLAFASLLAAVALEAWIGRREWAWLPAATLGTMVGTFAVARVRPGLASWSVGVTAYLLPVLFTALLGRFRFHHFVVWVAAAIGSMLATPGTLAWSYPRRWRWALIAWATVVATAWPLIVLREYDFRPFALDAFRLGNSGAGGHPRNLSVWIADVAAVHLAGLLWLDWLFRRARAAGLDAFRTEVAAPLAVSVLAGSLLAIYQGLVDLTFLSGGVWPSVGRAAGSMVDGNAYGILAALWTGGAVALLYGQGPVGRWAAAALIAVCWAGLWMSGSRTAFGTAAVALLFTLAALVQREGRSGWRAVRWRPLLAACALAVGAVAVLSRLPVVTETPLERLQATLPNPSPDTVRATARELWNRNGYGSASTRMVAEFPAFGTGLGTAHLIVTDYSELATGVRLPPDNAQNWWRHHVAELGFVGSAGLLAWSGVLLVLLATSGGRGVVRLPSAALKGAVVGFGLVSSMGVPAQNPVVTVTFWTFVFWYAVLVRPEWTAGADTDRPHLSRVGWVAIVAIAAVHAAGTVYHARRDLRVPDRAARFGWNYQYGAYPAEQDATAGEFRWTADHAVIVVPRKDDRVRITAWIEHPDAGTRPVHVRVRVNGATIVDEERRNAEPVTRAVTLPAGRPRFVVETDVDRTWQPSMHTRSADDRELGAAIAWSFE